MIHAAGLRGIPAPSHRTTAAATASCSASSARSKDPDIRMSAATIRPPSSRKTDSTAARASVMGRSGPRERPRSEVDRRLGELGDRPDLDAAALALAGRRDPLGPLHGLVEDLAFQDVVDGELLLRISQRA